MRKSERSSRPYLGDAGLLNPQIVENVGQRLQGDKLSSTNMLFALNIVVGDLEQTAYTMSNRLNNFTKSLRHRRS